MASGGSHSKSDQDGTEIDIITLGDQGVGKSCILDRFINKRYRIMPVTIIDTMSHSFTVDGKKVDVKIWDTAGSEKYCSIMQNYYRDKDGILLVYDVTRYESYMKLKHWLDLLRNFNTDGIVLIVGNKCDEVNKKNVNITAVKKFAEEEALEYMECSAKSGENVDMIFEKLTRMILIKKGLLGQTPANHNTPEKRSKDIISLDSTSTVKPKKGCCC